ncbi:DUF6261 family protein [Mangrovibacterium lignilyticum]|uniref:DUF6261 family protein n=1 Tax=Mangrovibacterium lignilyticum TaxID=2668052 RepID=UPI0013D6EC1B|nr:DUF6261 family protein [Mangrovibacterium lignilyticum]
MIKEIFYSYFSLARLHALAKKIKELLATKFPDQLMIAAVLAPLEARMAVALQAIGSSTKNPLTKDVRQADKDRDDSYISLKNHVRAGLRRRNADYRTACEALWVVFEKNNSKLYQLADEDETSAIDSLVADLKTAENQAHLATINAVGWLAELDADNLAFSDASANRSAARSTDNTVDDKKAFADLKASLELLPSVLTSLCLMNDPAGIQEAVAEINQYISEDNAAAKQSSPRDTITEGV